MRMFMLIPAAMMIGCAGTPAHKTPASKTPVASTSGEKILRLNAAIPGTNVSFASGGETIKAVVYRPAGGGPFPAVVVLHEDHGLTDAVKRQAQRLAAKGFLALAVDLFRGHLPTNEEDAHIIERGLPDGRAVGDVKAALDWLANRTDVRTDALGVIGWDMGAGYALDAAIAEPRIRACVVCYGRLTTDAALLKPLAAPVLGVFAGDDAGIDENTVRQFRNAMEKAGKRAVLHVYPKVGHGFMMAEPPGAHASGSPTPGTSGSAAREDAWVKITGFLAAELGSR